MSSYLLGTDGAVHVTGPDGKTTLVPGFPVTEMAAPQAAVLAGLVTDSESFLAPAIAAAGASSLLPALLAGDDTIPAPALGASALLSPALIADAETFTNTSIAADAPGHGRQTLRPGAISDSEVIYASAIGASLKPALVPADDAVYPVPSISAAKGTALVVDADAFYAFTTTLFVQPSLVASDDAVPAADVGWKVFASFTGDADHVFAPFSQAWNYMVPDVWADGENLTGYPFFIHGLSGGIPVPPPIGVLKGSLRPPLKVLTGSFNRPRLTGSLKSRTQRVLTGSLHNRKNR